MVGDQLLVIVIGGLDSQSSPLNGVWTSGDGLEWALVRSRSKFTTRGCVVTESKLLVLGGKDSSISGDVWGSTAGAEWELLKHGDSEFSARYGLGAALFLGKVWVIGGQFSSDEFLSDVWKSFSGAAKNWTQVETVGNIFSSRSFAGVTVHDGRLWFVGGCCTFSDVYWRALSLSLSLSLSLFLSPLQKFC